MATVGDGATWRFDAITRAVATEVLVINRTSGNLRTTVILDSDPQWGKRAQPLGGVSVNGGEFRVDARNVRWFSYYDGAGSYPDISVGANLKRGGSVLGEVLGIWTTFPGDPAVFGSLNAGGAASAAGWVKVRSLSSAVADNDALTIVDGTNTMTLTANGADTLGWLTVIGYQSTSLLPTDDSVVALYGDWWYYGVSTGVSGQTFNHYTTLDIVPCVWVEKTAGSSNTDDDYELWANIGNAPFTAFGNGRLGRVFKQSGGVISFGNGTNGNVPPAGARVRVANLHINTSDATSWASSSRSLNTSSYSNFRISSPSSVGAAVTVLINKVIAGAFYLELTRNITNITDFATIVGPTFSGNESNISIKRLGVGQHSNVSFQAINWNMQKVQAVIEDSIFCQLYYTGPIVQMTDSLSTPKLKNSTIYAPRGTSSTSPYVALYLSGLADGIVEGCVVAGGPINILRGSHRATLFNNTHSDVTTGVSLASPSSDAIKISGSRDVAINGLAVLSVAARYYAFIYVCDLSSVNLVDIGTFEAPIDLNNTNAPFYVEVGSTAKSSKCYFANIFGGFDYSGSNLHLSSRFYNCADFSQKVLYLNGTNTSYRGVRIAAVYNVSLFDMYGSNSRINTENGGAIGIQPFDVFTSDTTGAVVFAASQNTTDRHVWSVTAGSPVTYGTPYVAFFTAGDEIELETPYWVMGHTGFQNIAPSLCGSGSASLAYTYALDSGSGYGAWKAATGANLAAETIDPATGFRMKIRVYCLAPSGNAASPLKFNAIGVFTSSTREQQKAETSIYSTDFFILTLANVVVGSRVHVETATGGAPIADVLADASTLALSIPVSTTPAYNELRIKVRKGSSPTYQPWETLATAVVGSNSIYVSQIPDE